MNTSDKIVVDRNIPFVSDVLGKYFSNTVYAAGAEISPEMVRDASALVIRTRTRCDGRLLDGSSVRLVASATIGEDHVDASYCSGAGIRTFFAKGCNSSGVQQYVFTVLSELFLKFGYMFTEKTIGVVGVGHVGSKVAELAGKLGMDVVLCDPPKASVLESEGKDTSMYVPLPELLERSDIVTLHVPLEKDTYHMASDSFFTSMKQGSVFINSSRGEVADERSLLRNSGRFSHVVLDVWEHEPCISTGLLEAVSVATPHIAGYSRQGKINGSNMVLNELGRFFGIEELAGLDLYSMIPDSTPETVPSPEMPSFAEMMTGIFPVMDLDTALRSDPSAFEGIRSSYVYRNGTVFGF